MRASLVSLLAQSLSLLSFTYALQIYWPNQVFEYQAVLVKWDGEALYHFRVQQINANGSFTILNDDSGLNVTELQWFASIPAGQTIFFFLSDSTGSTVQSDNVVIQPFNVTNTQTSSQSSSSTTSPASGSSSLPPTSTTDMGGSTPTSSVSTLPTQGNGSSIPYIVGVLCSVFAIIASVFLWRFLRAYLRRRSLARHNTTSGDAWWSPKEGPGSDMAQAPSTSSPFVGSSTSLLSRGVGVAPKDLPPKNASVENLHIDRTEYPSFPRRTRDSVPVDLDVSIASSYPIYSVPTTASSHGLPREPENVAIVDNARASSVMLPITAGSDRTPGTHSISRSASHRTTRTTRSSNDSTASSRGRPVPNFESSSRLILPHEPRTSRLSVPLSSNPFDDTVFAVPVITESTPRSHSKSGARSSTSFPQDPEYGSEDEISIRSVSPSYLARSRSPVSNLPTINTTLKRTLTRAARDYPRTPTTPYSPASTTHTDASLPLPNTTISPGRSISISPYVNLAR